MKFPIFVFNLISVNPHKNNFVQNLLNIFTHMYCTLQLCSLNLIHQVSQKTSQIFLKWWNAKKAGLFQSFNQKVSFDNVKLLVIILEYKQGLAKTKNCSVVPFAIHTVPYFFKHTGCLKTKNMKELFFFVILTFP